MTPTILRLPPLLLKSPVGRFIDISLRRCAGERSILRNMKPTLIALLALCLCLVGCGKREPVQPSASDLTTPPPEPEASNPTAPQPFEETKAKAEAGDAMAQINLGFMYHQGQGVEQDLKEAVKWYQKAADQGQVNAQYTLGWMYANGRGVEQNYVTACAWYNIAAAKGDTEAATWKDNTAKQLTLAQITQAQALSRTLSSQIRTP